MLIIDAHLDLGMNAMEWNRDLRLPVELIREREQKQHDKPDRGKGTVSLPALRKGQVGLVVATQIARYVAPGNPLPGWHSPEQAWAQTQAQLAWYKAMEAQEEMVQVKDLPTLEKHLKMLAENVHRKSPVGYVLSLEGADSIVNLDYLETAWNYGLRAIGPAHYGPGRYANGTDSTGKMNKSGLDLLKKMEEAGFILDATHLCDDAFWQALENFNGHIWASHSNCRTLVEHNRQLNDQQIQALIERGAVIGGAFDAWMLVPNWKTGESAPTSAGCRIETVIDHMDHICQIAGNSLHVGIGSDLDGAFGTEQSPCDLDTIADLQSMPNVLKKRGFEPGDIDNIMHANWLRFIKNAWS